MRGTSTQLDKGSVRVVDAVTAGEGRHDEGEELVAGMRPTGCRTEIEVLIHELAQIEMMGEGGWQEEPRVGDQAVVVEGHIDSIEAVR